MLIWFSEWRRRRKKKVRGYHIAIRCLGGSGEREVKTFVECVQSKAEEVVCVDTG